MTDEQLDGGTWEAGRRTGAQCPVCLMVWLAFGEPGIEVRCAQHKGHRSKHRASVWGLTTIPDGISTIAHHDGEVYRGPREALDLRLTWQDPRRAEQQGKPRGWGRTMSYLVELARWMP